MLVGKFWSAVNKSSLTVKVRFEVNVPVPKRLTTQYCELKTVETPVGLTFGKVSMRLATMVSVPLLAVKFIVKPVPVKVFVPVAFTIWVFTAPAANGMVEAIQLAFVILLSVPLAVPFRSVKVVPLPLLNCQ